jgi:hypothetical protein
MQVQSSIWPALDPQAADPPTLGRVLRKLRGIHRWWGTFDVQTKAAGRRAKVEASMRLKTGIHRMLKASDGRIRIGALAGVSVVVALIALLVGMLPAFARTGDQMGATVAPEPLDYGGGDGGCAAAGSVAGNELHIANPSDDTIVTSDGTQFTIDVSPYDPETGDSGLVFAFTVDTPGIVVYDVTVNGGPKSNQYNYDGAPVTADEDLHAPAKGNGDLFNLSHVNICYDVQMFFCDGTVTNAIRLNFGTITEATALLVENSDYPECNDKDGVFVIDNEASDPYVELSFGDGTGTVAGRLDITKDFGSVPVGGYPDLQYDGSTSSSSYVDVPWCDIRSPKAGSDGHEFEPELASDEYPDMPADHTACKVFEGENAAGIQHNVVYFEFADPRFK